MGKKIKDIQTKIRRENEGECFVRKSFERNVRKII